MKTWVVLPTLNEAENISQLVRAICCTAPEVEVLVVDDSSPDGTGEIAERLAADGWPVRVQHRVGKRGLGAAYQAGFEVALRAGADAVMTMDCDFSHDPGAIPSLLEALPFTDLVIGSRYVVGGRIENWPLYRKLLSSSANRFVRTLLGLPVHDCTSGFRIYRKEVLRAIPWDSVRSTGYSFLGETLYWAAREKWVRIREVPICFTDRECGKSKLGGREAVCGAVHLFRLRIERSAAQAQPRNPLSSPRDKAAPEPPAPHIPTANR
jgi:dolichol-phosphate mannosyltransferase